MTDTIQSEDIIEPVEDENDEIVFKSDELLGKYISHHPVNRLRLIIQAGVVYFIITSLLQLVFYDLDNTTASIVLIFLFAGLALALGWYVMHLWNREVIIYEHGFNYREGSSIADFHYNEVVSFRQKAERLRYFGGLFRRNVYSFTVRTIRDEVMKVTNLYTDIEKLGHNLEIGINSVLRNKITRALQNGEAVTFGVGFEVSQAGITADGRVLAWDAFAGFGAKGGHLTIASTTDETWYQIPLEEVDNLTLLFEVLRGQAPKQSDTD